MTTSRSNFRLEKYDNENLLLILLVSLVTITTFLVLFVFRSWDDNRLTSWQWVFVGIDVRYILTVVFMVFFLSYALSRISTAIQIFSERPTQWLFVSSFVISAFFWGAPEIIVDASRYFIQAKYLELYGIGYFLQEWGNQIPVWTDLPLVPLLYGLIFKFFGEYRIAIQIFNSLLFSGTVVLTYLIGKTLWDKTIGFYAAILFLAIPYLLTQVPLMLVDIASMFFFTLALFTTIKAIRQGGTLLLILAAIAIVLAMLSKYSLWLMLSVIPVIFLCHIELGWKILAQRAAAMALVTVLLGGLILFWKYNVFIEQLRLLQDYQIPGLKRWSESFTSTFFFQTHPYITLAALFSVYAAVKNKDYKYAIISWLLLLVIVLEIKRARYLIVIFPMLLLMAAYGMREIRNVIIGKFIIGSAVVSSLLIALFVYLPFLQNTSAINLSQAGKYLDHLNSANNINTDTIEVITLPQDNTMVNPAIAVALLDLSTQKELVYRFDQTRTKSPDSIRQSSLRFSWEYNNPSFFLGDNKTSIFSAAGALKDRTPLAIIFGKGSPTIPTNLSQKMAGYRLLKELTISDTVFRYQTLFRLYIPI